MTTHNNEFCSQLCPDTWVLEGGLLDCQGDPEWMAAAAKEAAEWRSPYIYIITIYLNN